MYVRVRTIVVCRSRKGWLASCNGQTASVESPPARPLHPAKAAIALAEAMYPRTPHRVMRQTNLLYSVEVQMPDAASVPSVPLVPSPAERRP